MKLSLPGGRTLALFEPRGSQGSQRYPIDTWITDYLLAQQQNFTYNSQVYTVGAGGTYGGPSRTKEVAQSLPAYMGIVRKSPPAFAAQMVRALVLSQLRFTFRYKTSTSTPRKMFGTPALRPLEQPWTNATTGELVSRMEWDAGLAGNAFVTNFIPDQLTVLRPDWTVIIWGSRLEPDDPKGAVDRQVIGYAYQNGGFDPSNTRKPLLLRPEQVAHWSPLPDPLSPGLGMSWLTPALRDIQGDNMMIEHKIKYFEQGATPNLVVTGVPGVTPDEFQEWVKSFGSDHDGYRNAYRTMYFTLGMDAKIVGANLDQIDFAENGSYSETRISFLSRVPAALLGISAGLKGSSLNAGNYTETRRTFSDTWFYPTAQDLCAALAPLVEVPPYAELWFDTTDVPMVREDAQIAAQIEDLKSHTIVSYVQAGFTPESAIAAVRGQDISQLKHDPRFTSVQLQVLANGGQQSPQQPAAESAQETAQGGNQNMPVKGGAIQMGQAAQKKPGNS